MFIPFGMLSHEALHHIATQHVLQQQGNDPDDTPLDERVEKTMNAIRCGSLVVLYSEANELPYLKQPQDIKAKTAFEYAGR